MEAALGEAVDLEAVFLNLMALVICGLIAKVLLPHLRKVVGAPMVLT